MHRGIFRWEEGYWGARALLLIRVERFYGKREIVLYTNNEFLIALRMTSLLFAYTKTLNGLLQSSKQDNTENNVNEFEKV